MTSIQQMVRDLGLEMPTLELGNNIFCKIDDGFLTAMAELKKKFGVWKFVDCGAGMGEFGRLAPKGSVVSLDRNVRAGQHESVQTMDVFDCDFSKDMMPVFIRPCHDGFVQGLIEKLAEEYHTDFIYVSMPYNVKRDFYFDEDPRYSIKRYGDWEGEDGEHIFIVSYDRYAKYRKEIRERTKEWIELTAENGAVMRIPKLPLLAVTLFLQRFAENRMWDAADALWKPVSPPGVKMQGDFPHHTDWLLGMTVNGEDYPIEKWGGRGYGADREWHKQLESTVFDWSYEVRYGKQEIEAIAGGGKVLRFSSYFEPTYGDKRYRAGKALRVTPSQKLSEFEALDKILVLNNGAIEYHRILSEHPTAVILGAGGQLCHLAVNNLDQNQVPMGLCTEYKQIVTGDNLIIDFEKGTVTIVKGRWDD